MPNTEQELHARSVLLDAMTCLKSAHEEMLCGNYQRAEMFTGKAEIILAETRKQADALIRLSAQPKA